MSDWAGDVLFHADLSPLLQKHFKELGCLLALRRTCKQAPVAVVFKPTVACELLREHTG